MKSTKWWLGILMALVAISTEPLLAEAATEMVAGVEWTYSIANGLATVSAARPSSGDLTIPSLLGGCPVTSINRQAFAYSSEMTSVTIPESVSHIGVGAFFGCNGLTSVHIHDLAAWCAIVFDGANNGANPLLFAGHLFLDGKEVTDLSIPDGVTSIGEDAFYGCRGIMSVTIPNSVISIGSNAFYGCRGVKSVKISESLTSIGLDVFCGCSGLTSVSIPNSVTHIGSGAFLGCNSLTNVMIPASVTHIEGTAFYDCKSLKSVTVPTCVCQSTISNVFPAAYRDISTVTICEGATSIGEKMFFDCSGLTSVTIPASVTRIKSNAFSGCNALAVVHIHDLAAWCAMSFDPGGTPFSYAQHLFLDGEEVTALLIPDGVLNIGADAFSGCNSLTSATICASVTNIGACAFSNCYNLRGMAIPDSVKSIGNGAFENCKGMGFFSIGKGVATIGDGVSTSYDCHATFANAYTLTAFSVDPENPHFKSVNGILYTKDGKELVAFPAGCRGEFAVPNGVEKIWTGAFCGAYDLKLLIFPDSVTEIGNGVFYGCSSLADIYLPARFRGNERAYFAGSTSGHTFTYGRPVERTLALDGQGGIVETVTIHPTYCEAMPAISVPIRDGYKFCGYFSEPDGGGVQYYTAEGKSCRTWDSLSVTTLYAKWVEKTVVAVEPPIITPGDGAIFTSESCEVSISCATAGAAIYFSTNGTTPRLTSTCRYTGPFNITDSAVIKALAELDGVKSAYASATIRKMSLTLAEAAGAPILPFTTGGAAEWHPVNAPTSASGFAAQCGTIGPESETWMETTVSGAGTFSFAWKVDCEWDDSGAATWDHLAVSVDSIEAARIDGTTEWASVSLALEGAGTHAVRWSFVKDDYDEGMECQDLAWVADVEWAPAGGVTWSYTVEGGIATVTGAAPADGNLSIPSTLGGYPVTIIGAATSDGEGAFDGCDGLTSVTIPASVTFIGYRAFCSCSGLVSVTIPASVTRIGAEAFDGCSALASVAIPAGVTNIEDSVFDDCSALASIAVAADNPVYASQDGVLFTKDGHTLLLCPAGKTGSYSVPSGVTDIAAGAFYGCRGLTNVAVPSGVTDIGYSAFCDCSGLKTLYMPSSWQGKTVSSQSWDSHAEVPATCKIIYSEPEMPTVTTTGVPHGWLEDSAADILAPHGGDYETAALAAATNGLPVWQCYVAGLSTTEAKAEFKVKSISFENGEPVVAWNPDLNENGTKTNRTYRVEGSDQLGEGEKWLPVEENGMEFRFFRVRVGMP